VEDSLQETSPEPIRIATDVSVQMAFACENFSTDPMQRVTFHNVIEQLNAPAFPVQTALLYVVFGFQRNVPGFLVQCRVEIVPPTGEPVGAQVLQDLAFRPDQMVQRAIVGFQGTIWPQPGQYTVRFTSRGQSIASFVLPLIQVQAPQPPTQR
jgi:hypothetical protein